MESSRRGLRKRRPPPVLTAKFSNDGNFIFTGGKDKFLRVWEYKDATLTTEYPSHNYTTEIRDVCLTKDDSKMAYCHGDGTIFCYDFSTGKRLRHIEGHKDGVNAVMFDEFGSVIVSADSCVRLWDFRSPRSDPVQIFDTFKDSVTSLCLGRMEIFAGSLDGSLQLFDLRNHKRLSQDLGAPVTCISMADSDKSMLASCLKSTIQHLRVDTTYIVPSDVYKGHTSQSSKVGCCFTRGCTKVVGGSEDGCVFMWNFADGDMAAEFEGHTSAVTSVDYHPTEDSLLSASMDGSIILRKAVM